MQVLLYDEYRRFLLYKELYSLEHAGIYTQMIRKLISDLIIVGYFHTPDPELLSRHLRGLSDMITDFDVELRARLINKIRTLITGVATPVTVEDLRVFTGIEYGIQRKSRNCYVYCGEFSAMLNIENLLRRISRVPDPDQTILIVTVCMRILGISGGSDIYEYPKNFYEYLAGIGINCEYGDPLSNCEYFAFHPMFHPENSKPGMFKPDIYEYFGGVAATSVGAESKITGVFLRDNVPPVSVRTIQFTNSENTKPGSDTLICGKISQNEYSMVANHFYDKPISVLGDDIIILSRNITPELAREYGDGIRSELMKSMMQPKPEIQKMLAREYTRYIYICRLVDLGDRLPVKVRYEWANILERLLLSMANSDEHGRDANIDQIFIDCPKHSTGGIQEHPIYKKFHSEIDEKHIKIGNMSTDQLVTQCCDIIREFLNLQKYTTPVVTIVDHFYYIRSGSDQEIVQLIDDRRKSALYHAFTGSQDCDILIALVIIRYRCVLNRGQQWNIPNNWHRFLYEKFDNNIECFASPLNCQILLMANNWCVLRNREHRIGFCSLFYDTDRHFGSVGNLFEFDRLAWMQKNNLKSLTVTLNPPYVPDIMSRMVDLISGWLNQSAPITVFTGLPSWTDADYYIRLTKNPHLRLIRVLTGNDFYYQNAISDKINRITTYIGYTTFILSNNRSDPDPNTRLHGSDHNARQSHGSDRQTNLLTESAAMLKKLYY